MLKQEIGWFDSKENSIGALTTKLTTDSTVIKEVVSDQLGTNLTNLANIGLGIVISVNNEQVLFSVRLFFVSKQKT